VSQSLSRWQSVVLGLVVLAAVGLGGYGVARIAERQGLWADSVEVTAGFPEVHDIAPGTVVRIRGVDAGQVVAVEYPDHDGPGAEVTVRMKLNGRFAGRVYADASAQIYGSGVLGPKVISIDPGTAAKGPTGGRLRGVKPFGVDEAMAEVRDTADEVRKLAAETKGLVKEVRDSNGTLMKLVKEDDLYNDMKKLMANADRAVTNLEAQTAGLGEFVSDGRDTLRSVKQGSDAMSRLPIVRNYVEDSAAILVRPNDRRDMWYYSSKDLFEPGKAELSYQGQVHLNNLANLIKENKHPKSEVVAVAFHDPADKSQTPAAAYELTKKQAEMVINHLKICDVHKLGYVTRRKMTPLGMGVKPSPVIEKDPLPIPVVQIMVFTPQ
jgi:hypothetical protein